MTIHTRRILSAAAVTTWAALVAVLIGTTATHLGIGLAAAAVTLTLTATVAHLITPLTATARLWYSLGRDER